jgi:hypothetical protein
MSNTPRTFTGGLVASGPTGTGKRVARSEQRMPMAPPPTPPAPPPPAGTVTPAIIQFAADAMARPESQHTMALDEGMRREMVAVTHVLAPRAGATHVAVQDGAWSDPTTFLNVNTEEFETPVAGAKVLVPDGVEVLYDVLSDTYLDTVRLDGRLQFPSDQSTRMVVDTIVQDHGSNSCGGEAMCGCSRFRVGTVDAPLEADKTCEVVFPPRQLDPSHDELLIGHGLISMGQVRIYGAEKTPYVECRHVREIGDTTVHLPVVPDGWRIGDKLTITGTQRRGRRRGGGGTFEHRQCDAVTITNISGATITFTPALQYAKNPPTDPDFLDCGYFVINETRNVRFYTPGTVQTVPSWERAHVMFMHDVVDCRWAESSLMGRTRKGPSSDAAFPATFNHMRPDGVTWNFNSNVQGRYAWHLHRAGVLPGQPAAYMEGLSCADAPGWLMAHHSSIATWDRCVGVRFRGSGMVSEVGDEAGRWRRCLMAWNQGSRSISNDQSEKFTGNGVPTGNKFDVGVHDAGYWHRSRGIVMEDCIAADVGTGATWASREVEFMPFAANLPEPRAHYGGQSQGWRIAGADDPAVQVKGFVAAGCRHVFVVVKSNVDQAHSFRSMFTDVRAWECGERACNFEYTAAYTVSNAKFLSSPDMAWMGNGGSNHELLSFNLGTMDMTAHNVLGKGLYNAAILYQDDRFGMRHKIYNLRVEHSLGWPVRPLRVDPTEGWRQVFWYVDDLDDPPFPGFGLTYRQFPATAPAYNFVMNEEPVFSGNAPMHLQGTFTGRLGENIRNFYKRGFADPASTDTSAGENKARVGHVQRNLMVNRYGYWTHGGNRYLLIPDVISDYITDEAGEPVLFYFTVVARLADYNHWNGKTNNGQLPQRYVDAINAETWTVVEDIIGMLEEGPIT